MDIPFSSTEELVVQDRFERGERRDAIDQGEANTTDESTVSRAIRPQTLSVNLQEEGDEIDFRHLNGGDEPDGSRNPKSPRNEFTDSRNFVRQLCDTSLLAANASQVRAVLDNGSENSYFIPLLVMIVLSILCHVAFGILKIQRWKKEREAQMKHSKNNNLVTTPQSQACTVNPKGVLCPCKPCVEVERYDEISMYVMFLVVISNVGIAGLGLSGPEKV
uniref:Uncharacterized protein LOC111100614 n=1 Tax=Crassostrea virginica TaxID=6565 RepID=A0A8B8AA94_CRAVI|nr:uncharacterized protein LOC111100614 [Crassostrea virginica]